MIFDSILLVLQGVLNVLLAPLTVLNISIDLVSSLPVVSQFLQVIAYILPWSNILPIIIIVIAIFLFRITISIIKTILNVIPFV